jgi:sirohydrochlorin cobaltochelatase
MKTTILLVGHGSRLKAGNEEIERFAQIWRDKNTEWTIKLCFIEFADVLLDAGLDNAAAQVEQVIVAPLILNAAGHVKMEIPHHIDKARTRHPGVKFIYARHLGANEKIFAVLKRSLHKILMDLHMPDPQTTGIILLGRGSSDRFANGENARLARYLFEDSHHELVDPAFTGISFPRLETVVRRQVRLGMTQIAVLPYYLFTGTLMERIRQQINRLQEQYPQISFALGKPFGFEDEIYHLLDERVKNALQEKETVMMECDGCSYRRQAESKHHHHDHDEKATT